MASFRTHMAVAGGVSSAVAAVAYSLNGVELQHSTAFALCGLFGGILPDIDSDRSSAIRVIFTLFAAVMSLLVFGWYYDTLPLVLAGAAAAGTYLLIRYPVKYVFAKFTVHRGIFHSVLASVLMGFVVAAVAYHVLFCDEITAWFAGFFVFLGYNVHLLLDELYSVDFSNNRLKKSFGTAFKLLSVQNPATSLAVAVAAVVVYFVTPNAAEFTRLVFNSESYRLLAGLFS